MVVNTLQIKKNGESGVVLLWLQKMLSNIHDDHLLLFEIINPRSILYLWKTGA